MHRHRLLGYGGIRDIYHPVAIALEFRSVPLRCLAEFRHSPDSGATTPAYCALAESVSVRTMVDVQPGKGGTARAANPKVRTLNINSISVADSVVYYRR